MAVVSAMGVPLTELAALGRHPAPDRTTRAPTARGRRRTSPPELVVGPQAERPLRLDIPIFVSDMSFGALSSEAKTALARGAELAGTGICSGEGGMLPEEQAENSHYFYELASGRFGWDLEKVKLCQAFHFKAGQGAKTGTGGHLPGSQGDGTDRRGPGNTGRPGGHQSVTLSRISRRRLDFAELAARGSERSPVESLIGFKMSAQHIEDDLDFALEVGVDYVILDGRGGATGAAPDIFKNNISVPTMAALGRARRHLDARAARRA